MQAYEDVLVTTWHTRQELVEQFGTDLANKIIRDEQLEKKLDKDKTVWLYKIVRRVYISNYR